MRNENTCFLLLMNKFSKKWLKRIVVALFGTSVYILLTCLGKGSFSGWYSAWPWFFIVLFVLIPLIEIANKDEKGADKDKPDDSD